jgi:predicted nucleic acid-binding protein
MPASTAPWICVDASIVVSLVTRGALGSPYAAAWRQWHQSGLKPVAPSLLIYEVVNVLHRYVRHGMLLPEEASDALEAVLGLGIDLRSDAELHPRALALAGRLGLAAAYDVHHVAHYLALAERLGVEFWTADRRLQQAVGATLPWVRLLEA